MTHTIGRRKRRRASLRAGGVAVLAVAPLVLASCGGDANATGPAEGATAQGSGQATGGDFDAFRQCLADNGVEMPAMPDAGGQAGQGGAPPSMPDQAAMDKAMQACADVAPGGGPGGPGAGFGGGSGGSGMQAYAQCLTDHGVTMPTPGQGSPPPSASPQDGAGPTGQPPAGGAPMGLDTSDPTVAAAVAACADLAPSPPSGAPGAG